MRKKRHEGGEKRSVLLRLGYHLTTKRYLLDSHVETSGVFGGRKWHSFGVGYSNRIHQHRRNNPVLDSVSIAKTGVNVV